MKPKISLPFLLSLLIFNSSLLISTVRYVSPTGNSTPPYTSWETAADSIMECINISVFGDTIYVANGTYKEQVVMIPGLSLIGAGMDSCVIDTRELVYSGFQALIVHDMGTVKYFRFLISNDGIGTGVYTDAGSGEISHNYFLNPSLGVALDNTSVLLELNFFISTNNGAFILGLITPSNPKIYNNIIEATEDGIGFSVGSDIKPEIINNIFILQDDFAGAYGGSLTDTVKIFNNLVIAEGDLPNAIGISLSNVPTICAHNYIFGKIGTGIIAGREDFLMNNVVENGYTGYYLGDTFQFTNNNAWQNINNYSPDDIDSTNLSVDPMIVNDDSTKGDLDFHLQKFSPLIDAGDPNILDRDGSRSDIGLYGGPYGWSYTYNDLAPRPPHNLTAVVEDGLIKLTWNKNTEADFSHYRIYRDTVTNFIYDTTRIVGITSDTLFYDNLPITNKEKKYYYLVTAFDNQNNQSEPSEEVSVTITGLTEHPPIGDDGFRLLSNYPNPFNPSTIIPYRLKEPGYVKLYVYDIKGELVKTLVNQWQNKGYYEVVFQPNTEERERANSYEAPMGPYYSDIATGIYIYQIMVRGEGDIPVFSDMGKMILLK